MKNSYKILVFYILAWLSFAGAFLPNIQSGLAYLISLPCALFYILPSIIGIDKRRFNTIFVLNIFLGVVIIGWVIAFIMAIAPEKDPKRELL